MRPQKNKKVLLCDCEGTIPPWWGERDAAALAETMGVKGGVKLCRNLCRNELGDFVNEAAGEGEGLIVSCTQEQVTFQEQLAASGIDVDPTLVNIRERAGWSEEAAGALPKITALIAEARVEPADVPTVSMTSNGVCLVYGAGQIAVDAAKQLENRLSVSILLSEGEDALPLGASQLMISKGRIAAAAGHLGDFEVSINGFAAAHPSSRDAFAFDFPRDGAASRCDIILDLSGGTPLFPAHERREGYLRADPGDPNAVQRALFDAVDLVGEFEKPRYIHFREDLCAHSRSQIVGCTRCLDLCPVSAIQPAGDSVAIDPYICGGCGSCHSACPTGAADYAYPQSEDLLLRLTTLLGSYLKAGGERAVLMVHDHEHGWPLIEAMARFGRGLPARVLPFEVNEITQISLDFLLSSLALGAERVVILGKPSKRGDFAGLAEQLGMAEAIMTGLGYESGLIDLLVEDDPDRIESELYEGREIAPRTPGAFIPQAAKRANLRLAAAHLFKEAPAPIDAVPLAPGAPYGAVDVDTNGCTLCLACVSACPTAALGDNPDKPQLSFQEEACIQCGLCKNTCPEKVITLVPQFNFSSEAKDQRVLYEEEPFCCVSCGKPFASKSTIEKMVSTLAGSHSMQSPNPCSPDRLMHRILLWHRPDR